MLYILTMPPNFNFSEIKHLYKLLAHKMQGFYLARGTALSLCYFQHRSSYDLDFFTQEFSQKRVESCTTYLKNIIKGSIELVEHRLSGDFVKMMVFHIKLSNECFCKLDFVEDFAPLYKPLNHINGIDVLSLEDIYIRKLFAISGTTPTCSLTGKDMMIGGRQEAKDLYDIYFLSHTFIPLADFIRQIKASAPLIEGIIQWYRSFNRLHMKMGLHDLITQKEIDFQQIDHYISQQIELILNEEIRESDS